MSETAATENTAAAPTERKRAEPSNFLAIVRGRLPFLLVHAIRFDEVVSKMGNKDIATKFGTSVGKVFDIKKGRNFSYIDESYKPTAEDVAAAKDWANQFGTTNAKGLAAQGDKALIEQIVKQYEERGLATPEEAAKMSEQRASTRKPIVRKAKESGEGSPAPTTAASTASAEELLS